MILTSIPESYIFVLFNQRGDDLLEIHLNASTGANTMEDRWLSVDEIGVYLGVKRDTVYKWIGEKGMPAHKVGRLWKFQRVEVDEWVKAGRAAEKPASQ